MTRLRESAISGMTMLALGCGAAPASQFPCGMAFSPEPGLMAETVSAAKRWSAATGCDVRVEAGGWPVYSEDVDLFNREGKRLCAQTTRAVRARSGKVVGVSVVLDSTPPTGCPTGPTVLHEMGHALGAVGHTESGVMHPNGGLVIDSASLELVCLKLECAVFNPE